MENLKHLRQLVALAYAGNFRKAGDQLGVSHSAISQTIKKLEDAYGVELFDRSPGKTVPTAYGERLIASARMAINEMDAAERDIGLMENFASGKLIIGVDPSVSESLLSIPMTKMMNRYPSLHFTVRICNRARWEKRLSQHEIDIYFGLQPDREADDLNYRKLILQPPSLLCRSGHELLRNKSVKIEDFKEHTLIGGDVPDWFLWRILDAFPNVFNSLQELRGNFLTSQDFGLLRQLLMQTDAIAVLPDFVVRHEIEAGVIRRLDLENWPFNKGTISGVAAWLKERPLPPSAKRLLAEIQKILDYSVKISRHQSRN